MFEHCRQEQRKSLEWLAERVVCNDILSVDVGIDRSEHELPIPTLSGNPGSVFFLRMIADFSRRQTD